MTTRPKIRSFEIQWDDDFGIDHRRGWSIVINGSFAVQLEPWLIVAIFKAWRSYRNWEC